MTYSKIDFVHCDHNGEAECKDATNNVIVIYLNVHETNKHRWNQHIQWNYS